MEELEVTLNQCPICDSHLLVLFLHRSHVPVAQNFIMSSHDKACAVTRGSLDLVVCEDCGFIFNREFDASLLSYHEDYDNNQSFSVYFDAYLDGLVDGMVANGVQNSTIIEVGCGKGNFLRKLVSYPSANNKGVGFDPSYVGPDSDLGGRLVFHRRFYNAEKADTVVCRHVIEHVPEPMVLLRSIKAKRLFIETPCAEWVLRNRVMWDLLYEHCSLFTASSLSLACRRAGFIVEEVKHTFGGQYLWLEALREQPETVTLAKSYDEHILREKWLLRLSELKGKVALWGAGAKGATFANLIDPDCVLIDCVADLNPNKHGCYIPGTGHPIVAPANLPQRGVNSAVLMNPNYYKENMQLLSEAGIGISLIWE